MIDEKTGNDGWKWIAERMIDQYDVLQFEKYFYSWQKQAIFLTEITYAVKYQYVTPLGVFTHIGTLARALQHIFEKDWYIDASLVGEELSFFVNKHIKDFRHTLICTFVELDQAYSHKHCDGWKLACSTESLHIAAAEALSVINTLISLILNPEMESINHLDDSICAKNVEDGYILTRVPKLSDNEEGI